MRLSILYHDHYLAFIDKPPGLLVHRTGLDAGESVFALQLLRNQLGQAVWPVHRLDKGTSGVLLFALQADMARELNLTFSQGKALSKRYQAVVRGWPPELGEINHPLRRMPDDMRHEREEWQSAQTLYRTLRQFELPIKHGKFEQTRCALVELEPLTGRRHQLRRHMKHLAHPIIGDATHGKGPLNRDLAQFLGIQRLWLHAHCMTLRHPVTGETLHIESPTGSEWQRWDPYICK